MGNKIIERICPICEGVGVIFVQQGEIPVNQKRFVLSDDIVFEYVPSPGRIIRNELKARGWSQRDLVNKMFRPIQDVDDIINDKTEITIAAAIELGAVFGTSADFWLSLDEKYRLWLEEQESE